MDDLQPKKSQATEESEGNLYVIVEVAVISFVHRDIPPSAQLALRMSKQMATVATVRLPCSYLTMKTGIWKGRNC